MTSKICDCGNPAEKIYGMCSACLAKYDEDLAQDIKEERFEILATKERTPEELETEIRMTQSINEQRREPMSSTITDTKVFPQESNTNFKAFAQVTLNDDFVVRSIRLIDGRNGLFVGFPENRKDDVNHPICFPISATLRERIRKAVVAVYEGNEVPIEVSHLDSY